MNKVKTVCPVCAHEEEHEDYGLFKDGETCMCEGCIGKMDELTYDAMKRAEVVGIGKATIELIHRLAHESNAEFVHHTVASWDDMVRNWEQFKSMKD